MNLTATADDNQVIISETTQWGDLRPLRVLTLSKAAEFLDDLRTAVAGAKQNTLDSNKRRLESLKAEVARLEAATL